MKAYLTYALNNNGDLVHINSVPNGNDCGCICPHCKSELCAKNGGTGEKMVHHFAHQSGADCVGAIESALHKMAKDVMKEVLCIQLPDRLDGREGGLLKLDRVEVEFYDKDTHLRPDCIGYYGDKVIWIEFKRTHAVDTKKRGKIISAKIDCVELDINSCTLDPNVVRKFITEENKDRIWIRDTQSKPRYASSGNRYSSDYDDFYNNYRYSPIQRMFALDENGTLVNLLNDEFDTNVHSYYCVACGKELTIDVDVVTGTYIFVHTDENVHCEDDLYLHEAAKEIIHWRFNSENTFDIVVPQYQNCEEKSKCTLFRSKLCSTGKGVLYNLKKHGYNKSVRNCKLPNLNYKCDLVIKKADSDKDAIIITINAGDCYVDVFTEDYRIIEIRAHDDLSLLNLINSPISELATFMNFKKENGKLAPRKEMDRKVMKFSLFSSGKYHVDIVPCAKLNERKASTILEYVFVDGTNKINEAKLYSLFKCYEQKRKACYCEICWYLAKKGFYGMSEPICKRYKTRGTPHYPMETMPLDCLHFGINKELESAVKANYSSVQVIEQ